MNSHPETIRLSNSRTEAARFRLRPKWMYVIGAVVMLAISGWSFDLPALLKQALDYVASLGPSGALAFIAIYVAAAVLFLPGSVLTLGAGAVFGVMWGSVYVSIGSTLGATCAFLVGRHLARDAIARRIESNARFAAIDSAVASEGWMIVGLTRLSPVFPFALLNYAFGLTRVKLRDYVLASWVGMMPGTVMFVYLGSLARAATVERARATGEWMLYGVGLIATLAVTVLVTRMARRALAKRITE